MQVWLEPIENWDITSPLTAVLVRVHDAVSKAGYNTHNLQTALHSAARVAPGNLSERSGEVDIDCYAMDVVLNERLRVDLPHRIKDELQQIEAYFGQGDIEWCLPVIDPELCLPGVVEFVKQVHKQGWLTIYIVSDIDLSQFFKNARNVTHINEATFKAMNVSLGIPQSVIPQKAFLPPSLPSPSPTPAPYLPSPWGGPALGDEDDDDDIDDEAEKEENPPKKAGKGKPQYRNITDDFEPSW